MGKKTVVEVIELYEESADRNLSPLFAGAGVSYPPDKIALIAFKDSRRLEIWAANEGGLFKKITSYPVLAASGKLGPKLTEGDRQVPEGIYKVAGFNPNSAFHISMKLDYPNEFDLMHAKVEGRTEPGTNIFIHGREASVGCLAMGAPAIEEIFTLVYKTGRSNTVVIISPTDPGEEELIPPRDSPEWTSDLYAKIKTRYDEVTKINVPSMPANDNTSDD